MSCDAIYGTAEGYAQFFLCQDTITVAEHDAIEVVLSIVAADINAARAAQGACDCALATWAVALLAKLAYIEAAVMHHCPCGNARLTDEMRQAYLRWVSEQLTAIRTGALELCAGATGSDFPAVGNAQYSWTDVNGARIIVDTEAKNIP
jgi:hypothetical protein